MPQKSFTPSPDDANDPFDLRYKDAPGTPPAGDSSPNPSETVRSFGLLKEIRERLQRLESATQGPAGDLSGQSGELITSLKADRDQVNELLTDARRQLGKQEEKCRTLRKQVEYVQKKYMQRNERVAGLKAELAQARSQAEATLTELREQLAEQQQTTESLRAELDQARRRCSDLEQSIVELEAAKTEPSPDEGLSLALDEDALVAPPPAVASSASDEQLEALRVECETLRQQLDDAQRQIVEHDQQTADLRQAWEQERENLGTDLADSRGKLHEHQRTCRELEEQLNAARDECGERDRRIASLQETTSRLEETAAELAVLRQQAEAARLACDAAEAGLQEAEDLCRQRDDRINELTTALDELRRRAETETADARKEIDRYRQSAENLEQQLKETRDLCHLSEELLAEVRTTLEEQRRRAEDDLTAAERLAEEQLDACQALEAQLAEVRQERDLEREKLAELSGELDAERRKVGELTATLQQDRERAEADRQQAAERIATLEREAEALGQRIQDLQARWEQRGQELTEAREALAREREAAELTQQQHEARQQALQAELVKAEQDLGELLDRAGELEETLNRERQSGVVEMETLRGDLEQQRVAHQTLEQQLLEARQSNNDRDQRILELEQALTLQRRQGETALALAEQQLAEQQEQSETLTRDLDNAQRRAREIQEQVAQLNELLGKERETARAAISEARQQLQHQQHQVQALHARLVETQKYDAAREQQIGELKHALGQAAERIVGLEQQPQDVSEDGQILRRPPRVYAWPGAAKGALAAAIVLGLIASGVTAWFYEMGPGRPDYRVAGTVSVPSADPELLALCDGLAGNQNPVEATLDRAAGLIELSLHTRDRAAGIAKVNQVGQAIVAEVVEAMQPAADTRPAASPEYQQEADQLAALDRQLAAIANRPATVATEGSAQLMATWQQLRMERQKVEEALADLAPSIEPTTTAEAPLDISEEEIARAEAANQRLQADAEALEQRELQLNSRLRAALDAGLVQFQNVEKRLADADRQVNAEIQTEHPRELDDPLAAMHGAIASWSAAVEAAKQEWNAQRSAFGAAGAEPLAAQTALEKAARSFVEQTTAASATFLQALDSLGQGEGQVTRRLVLRNALVKQFTEVTDAQSGALAAARAVIISEDVELASIVQRLTGLRQRVDQQRQQTAETIRQQKLNALQNRRDEDLSQSRAKRDHLMATAAELDDALVKTAEQAVQMVTEAGTQRSALLEQLELQQRRAEATRRLMELQGSTPGDPNGQRRVPLVQYIPASTTTTEEEADGRRLRNAVLAGSAPLLAFLVIGGAVAMITSSRRSARSMEEYARCLIEAAQQSHDPTREEAGQTREPSEP